MSDSINEQRCERNGLPVSGCAASEYDCAKFGVCAAGPSVVTPPEPKCQCGHSEGFHRKSLPRPCKLKCPCLGFVLPAAPSVSTHHTDEQSHSQCRHQQEGSFHDKCSHCLANRPAHTDERGKQHIEKRLAEAASEIEGIERRLTRARFRRDALIAKLLAAGVSERHIAEIAKVSGPRVHQIKEAGRG